MQAPLPLAQFEWGTRLVDGMFPERVSGWIRKDGPKYQRPTQGWLTAHDVYHHLPGDTGSYAEEVGSFGAQAWMDLDLAPNDPKATSKLSTVWFSVMALTLEGGTRGLGGLTLPEPPSVEESGAHTRLFAEAYKLAVVETRDVFGEWGSEKQWDAMTSPEQVRRACGWALHGYRQAQVRWPDLAIARAGYDALEQSAMVMGQEGDQLHVGLGEDGRLVIDRRKAHVPAPVRRLQLS